MKVLMFGWEFPPHISGGLGTACFGLTQALLDERVKIVFVVPRLHGDENGANIRLISASGVPVRSQKIRKTESTISDSSRRVITARKRSNLPSNRNEPPRDVPSSIIYIEAPAAIAPYQSSVLFSRQNYAASIRQWNYPFRGAQDAGGPSDRKFYREARKDEETCFSFSGTYGADLLEEVRRYATVAAAIARQHDFDVIHAHDWMSFPAGIAARKVSKKPLVAHVHSTEFDRAGDYVNAAVCDIEKDGLTRADAVIAVSNWTKELLVSRYGIDAEKVRVIHNGIVPREEPGEFRFPDLASHFVTFLGRVTHQKGPRFFVEAAQKVLQEFPEAHFIIAGAGDLLPQIIERVAQLNMSANFHFTGFLSSEQVDHVWSLTDVYVMPSVSEPFGIAPLEAIQRGVPVILSNQSGVSEVMPHAIKVDFWDVKALAAAICSVLRYESLSSVLRQNSKRHIGHLTWEKAARSVNVLYHELTGNP